jgi:ATP-dependent Lhr-like helicase
VHDLTAATGLHEAEVRTALADAVAAGLVTSDGFGGLRAMIRTRTSPGTVTTARAPRASVAGRWSRIGRSAANRSAEALAREHDEAVTLQARALLRRYGVVCRRVLAREANAAPWRELTRVYRRLEARGEIRGGRFVSGLSGEQFALADAVDRLREIRRTPADGRSIVISAADPLNLAGIVTAGERVRAASAARIVYRDGVPLAAMEGDFVRPLTPAVDASPEFAAQVMTTLVGRPMPALLGGGYVGRS